MLAATTQQLFVSLVGLIVFVVTLYALIDAIRRPMWAYEAAHVSKTLWVVLLVLAFFIPCGGFLLALWWLFSTGPKVSRQAQIGRIGFPGR